MINFIFISWKMDELTDNYHRVRSIIPYLNYKALEKVIPKQRMFTSKIVPCIGGKSPNATLAKKLGASDYGIFVEKVIEILVENNYDINCLYDVKIGEHQKYFVVEQWKEVANLLQNHFKEKAVIAQQALYDNDIVGHPDLLCDDVVYDIKTTGKFGAMRILTIFQLLSYYCLCQKNKLNISSIGLVLPLQLKIIVYDLSTWNWKPFYEQLEDCIQLKMIRESLWNIPDVLYKIYCYQWQTLVGYHCHNKDLVKHINNNVPALQFFVSGNVSSVVNYDKCWMKEIKNAIIGSSSMVFIHAPYILNFSYPGKKEREEDKKIIKRLGEYAYGGWTFYCLKKLLRFGRKTGIKGIVIHCGKACGKNYDESVLYMYSSIIDCAQWATKECKILIETSCGQHGEILFKPKELIAFYLALPDYVKEVVSIVVDTCHTHTAGYDPMEFILKLHKHKVPIDLIHYNDSKLMKGARKDRHAPITQGYIGYESLNNVLNYAITNKIPMVME